MPPSLALLTTLSATVFTAGHAAAELTDEKRSEASALFEEYTSRTASPPAQTEFVVKLVALGPEISAILYKQIHPAWESALKTYEQKFAAAAASLAQSRKSGEDSQKIEVLRSTLRRLRESDNLTKDMLKSEGEPALNALRDLASIDSDHVLRHNPDLATLRQNLLVISEHRDLARDKAVLLTEPSFDEDKLQKRETEALSAHPDGADRDSLAILAENDRLASQIDPAEAAGIRDLNSIRILLGLRPVLLDPKLNLAAKGHSEDMEKRGFFTHESPVSGKETPWKRARLAGTSANAENIFAGSGDPVAANRAWFLSPGHHKNMFGNHARAAMGNYGSHWTQMFGN